MWPARVLNQKNMFMLTLALFKSTMFTGSSWLLTTEISNGSYIGTWTCFTSVHGHKRRKCGCSSKGGRVMFVTRLAGHAAHFGEEIRVSLLEIASPKLPLCEASEKMNRN